MRVELKALLIVGIVVVFIDVIWAFLEYRAQKIRQDNYIICLDNIKEVTKTMQENNQGIYTMPSCSEKN